MDSRTHFRRLAALFLFPLAAVAGPAAAQVGHDPATSPYRDLRYGQFLSFSAGKAFGGGGTLGIGPHDGTVYWLRHDFLADRPLSIGLGGGFGQLDRNYADIRTTTGDRVIGPVQHDVYFVEGTVLLNLTGGKTWNNLAPYAGFGLGLSFAEKLPQDSSAYNYGTKFFIAPTAGVRVFVSRRLFLRAEARAMFMNLSYPATYRSNDPDGFGPLLPLLAGQGIKEWAPIPVLHVGLGYAFRRPFF